MKTNEEIRDLAVNYVANAYRDMDVVQLMEDAYYAGFSEGREDAEADCNNTESLGGWLSKFKALRKLAEKANLYISAEIGFVNRRSDVTIYEYKNNHLGDVLFRANRDYMGDSTYRMMEFLLLAEEFIYKYTSNTEENLEKKLESLRAELAATRKNLAKIKKLNSAKEK